MIIDAALSRVDLTGQTKDKGRGQSSSGGGLSCPGLAGAGGNIPGNSPPQGRLCPPC